MDKSMPIKVQPYRHQQRAYAAALDTFNAKSSRGYAYLMDMGTGKSLTAISVAGRLYLDGYVNRVLVVAPLSIVGVWDEEFAKFADFNYTLTVLNGTGAKKAQQLKDLSWYKLRERNAKPPLAVAVVNYESAWRLEAAIKDWKPDLIIADEAHKMKTHNTNQSKAMHRLGALAKYKLLLTGTLITNHAEDVFSPYWFLEPRIFGTSFYSWRNRYFDSYGYGNYQHRLKKSTEQEFLQKIHSIAFRVTKAECLDLPETTDIVRMVELETDAATIYKKVVKECYAEIQDGEISVTNVLTKLLRLSQITGGFATDDDGKTRAVSTAKLKALADIVDEAIASDSKIVIIARFTAEIEAICRLLKKKEIQYARVDGSIKDRACEVDKFQNDPAVMAFVGQVQVAGLGLTLVASSVLVFYSLDYSTANHEQAKARIHRSGQTQACTYYYLLAKGTIDEKVLKSLHEKADFAKQMTDDFRHGRNPLL